MSFEDLSTVQEKIAQRSRAAPPMVWTTLAHHIDVQWLKEAYRRTRKDAAVGVDGVSAQAYETALEANLTGLLERFKTGRYRAPPVRRVHIPKEGAPQRTRPIGIPTLEDKILQRAVLMVTEGGVPGAQAQHRGARVDRPEHQPDRQGSQRGRPGARVSGRGISGDAQDMRRLAGQHQGASQGE